MNPNGIPTFDGNYIWVLNDGAGRCLIVDPRDAESALSTIPANNWQPEVIFLTHHHYDHVGGVGELVKKLPRTVAYGPQETQDKGTAQIVKDGETAFVLGHEFSVIATPGHTLGRIYYFNKFYLSRGDTLFSSGCGRLSEGVLSQMYQSIKKLNVLLDDTLVCRTREYTSLNMKLALSILPYDLSINDYCRKVRELRVKGQITLPVILRNERQINVFLRTEDIDLINITNEGALLQQPEERFVWLRPKKDRF